MSVVIVLGVGGLGVFAAGVVVGHVATRWGAARQLEVFADRKDTAIDAALGTAFELQRISGEHPQVVDSADFVGLIAPPGSRPLPMTGVRNVEAQDRELAEIYDQAGEGPFPVDAEFDDPVSLPRSLPAGRTYRTRLT